MKNANGITEFETVRIAVSKDAGGNVMSNILPENLINKYTKEQLNSAMISVDGFNVLECIAEKNAKGERRVVGVPTLA